jgi:hypothetical protein
VRQLENFAAPNPPRFPLKGQLWFNTNDQTLRVCPADGTVNASSWLILTSSTNDGTAQLGNVIVSGVVSANTITTNAISATSGSFNSISVAGSANIVNAQISNANIGNLLTRNISTGSPTTTGNLTGAWTLDRSLSVANIGGGLPHVVIDNTGIKTDAIRWANGVTIFDSVNLPYANSNVRAFLTTTTPPGGPRLDLFPNSVTAAANITVAGTVITSTLNVTGVSTLANVAVNGISTFGPVANVRISGGTPGQVLTTNGLDTLSWASPGISQLTGDVTTTGSGSAVATLTNTGIAAGTYKSITVDTKGRAITGTNPTTLAGFGITDAVDLATAQTVNGVKTFGAAVVEKQIAVAASTIDASAAAVFTKTITAATAFVISGAAPAGSVSTFVLQLTNGGSATVDYPASVKWQGGTKPTLTTAGVDILGFYTFDGGAIWHGFLMSKDSK